MARTQSISRVEVEAMKCLRQVYPSVDERLLRLESAVEALEAEVKRFLASLRVAGE